MTVGLRNGSTPLPSCGLRQSRGPNAARRVLHAFQSHPGRIPPRGVVASASIVKDLAKIKGECSLDVPITSRGDADADLGAYMMQISDFLPDISLPLGGSLKRTGQDQFVLTVTRMQIWDVWMQPQVPITIRASPLMVEMVSQQCHLEGSPQVDKLGLNERVTMAARIGFTWKAPIPGSTSAPQKLSASGRLDVNIDVPPALQFMPRPVFEGLGDVGLNATLRLMLASFVQTIAADYGQWASTPQLRATRRQAIAAKRLQEQQIKQRKQPTGGSRKAPASVV